MKRLLLALIMVLLVGGPVLAVDVDQINIDLINDLESGKPTNTESNESDKPKSDYNLWKGEFDPWTKKDTYWQLGFTAITLFDLHQTNIGLNNGGMEVSPFVTPFIGNYPTKKELYDLGYKWIVVNGIISYILPKGLRRLWQVSGTFITFDEVRSSSQAQLMFKF